MTVFEISNNKLESFGCFANFVRFERKYSTVFPLKIIENKEVGTRSWKNAAFESHAPR